MLANDSQADKNVLIYSLRPQVDYEWNGNQFDGYPEEKEPPPGRVFVVIVSEQSIDEHGISGSIGRWNWVKEQSDFWGAPLDWNQRYVEKLWSR